LSITNIQFSQSDWFTSLPNELFDMIVSNPPYIDESDIHLSQGDVRFEPSTALIADEDGFSDLAHIIATSKQYLKQQGWLLLEHGWQQGLTVRELFNENGYTNVETCLDYGGKERISVGQWNG
ncbi:HemK/PrmC family methyltransferase, partial [Providencia rettgeri]|uniref:HemK/PrmC family methyltransferase n=1 Tax=Providencia rettgeri TaxID=587 RepID=UPI0032D9DB20